MMIALFRQPVFDGILIGFRREGEELFPMGMTDSLHDGIFQNIHIGMLTKFFHQMLERVFPYRIITVYKGDIQSFSPLYPHISGIA